MYGTSRNADAEIHARLLASKRKHTLSSPKDQSDQRDSRKRNKSSVPDESSSLREENNGIHQAMNFIPTHASSLNTTPFDESNSIFEPSSTGSDVTMENQSSLYFILDLKTVGEIGKREIVQIGVVVVETEGKKATETFSASVRPQVPIAHRDVLAGHGMIDEELAHEEGFAEVGRRLLAFIRGHCEKQGRTGASTGVLVAFQGNKFQFPFLVMEMEQHGLSFPPHIQGFMDLQLVCRAFVETLSLTEKKSKFKDLQLGTLYSYFSQDSMPEGQDALAKALTASQILQAQEIWSLRLNKEMIQGKAEMMRRWSEWSASQEEETLVSVDMTEEKLKGMDAIQVTQWWLQQEEKEESKPNHPEESGEPSLAVQWLPKTHFLGVPALGFYRSWKNAKDQSHVVSTGLLCSPHLVQTPHEAFAAIFGEVMKAILQGTNRRGQAHDASWRPVNESELYRWFGIVSVAASQKRKDTPAHWFSSCELLGMPCVMQAMSRQRFLDILRVFHIFDDFQASTSSSSSPDRTPSRLMRQFVSSVFSSCQKLYAPEEDMRFEKKSRILGPHEAERFSLVLVSPPGTRYGIQWYALTCARTGYVLDMVPYFEDLSLEGKNEVDGGASSPLLSLLVEMSAPYQNSYRTLYTDRFPAGILLAPILEKYSLFVVGTLSPRHVPPAIRMSASKKNPRGSFIPHVCKYKNEKNQEKEIGVVAWMDQRPVYAMSSHLHNGEFQSCKRVVNGKLVDITIPEVIERYNQCMPGYDIADQRDLHIRSEIPQAKAWWMKLFWYTFDVAIRNAMILYQISLPAGHKGKHWTLSQFRMALNKTWLHLPAQEEAARKGNVGVNLHLHRIEPITGGHFRRCVVCSRLYRTQEKHRVGGGELTKKSQPFKTKHFCFGCKVPVCRPGRRSCFALLHESEAATKLYLQLYSKNAKSTNAKAKCDL